MTSTETFETIRYTADIVAVTPDRRVLLIERGWGPYEGHWALPGGRVDSGETSLAAAARELAEETGVHVAPADLRPIGVFDRPDRDPRGRYITVAYLAQVPADTAAVAGDDARGARWWPLEALPARLAFDHADILNTVPRQHDPGKPITVDGLYAKYASRISDAIGLDVADYASTPDGLAGLLYDASDSLTAFDQTGGWLAETAADLDAIARLGDDGPKTRGLLRRIDGRLHEAAQALEQHG